MKLMSTPKGVDISITNRCNLRCTYCFHFTSAGDVSGDLPKEEWLTFFEELGRSAVMKVTIEGGEPFCREDLNEIIEGIIRNRMRYTILSNGTLITDETAAFLARTRRCDAVQVSIDGSTPDIHDSFRGKGNFFRAISGIQHLKKHRLPVRVRTTIHRKNLSNLEGIAGLLLDEIGLSSFSTNDACFLGLCQQNTEEVQLTAKDHSLAMKKLLVLNKKYNGRITAAAGPLANANRWIKLDKNFSEKKKTSSRHGFLAGCGGTMNKIAVRADGVIVPCILMSHFELGIINKDDLKQIWMHHPELNRLRERYTIPLNSFEFCRDCKYIDYCTGDCPALAYERFGNEYLPSPDSCLKRFL